MAMLTTMTMTTTMNPSNNRRVGLLVEREGFVYFKMTISAQDVHILDKVVYQSRILEEDAPFQEVALCVIFCVEQPSKRCTVCVWRILMNFIFRAGPPVSAAPANDLPSRAFSGGGHTLGSDDVPSSFIPDPSAPSGESHGPFSLCGISSFKFKDLNAQMSPQFAD